MAIQIEDRQVIRAWTGPITDEAETEALLALLGSSWAVALQILMDRRAEMESTPARRSSGGDSLDHSENIKRVNQRIAELVTAIEGNSDVDLSDAGEALLASAAGGTPDSTRAIGLGMGNRRKGG